MPYQTVGLLAHLRKWGLVVEEEPWWQQRGNIGFNPKGVVCHHTAIYSDEDSVRVVRDGRPDLPGPLSEFVLKKSGVVRVIAAGRANHAGAGGWKGLSGNSSVWGIEAVHIGKTGVPWPNVQLEAYYKLSAALCTYSKFGSEFVCGHKEWSPGRKIDPIDLNMNQFRVKVSALLKTIIIGNPMEVDVQLTPVQLNIPLDGAGKGWVRVPYPINKIIGVLPHSGTRPGADGTYDGTPDTVGFTPEDGGTVVVVQGGSPGGSAPIWIQVIT